ncbi:MAG: hypothetical protein AB7F28_08415 [Candidatus Margulisiibacteriota bacterium]
MGFAQKDDYLILACDGVYDALSNADIEVIVRREVSRMQQIFKAEIDRTRRRGQSIPESVWAQLDAKMLGYIADALIREAVGAGSQDNISVMVIALKKEDARPA